MDWILILTIVIALSISFLIISLLYILINSARNTVEYNKGYEAGLRTGKQKTIQDVGDLLRNYLLEEKTLLQPICFVELIYKLRKYCHEHNLNLIDDIH